MIAAVVIVTVVVVFVLVCAIFRVGKLSDDSQYEQMERELHHKHLEKRNPK